MPWTDTRHTASRCPHCDHRLDVSGSPDGRTPKVGDISVCISCAQPLVFEEGLRLRAMTPVEFDNLDAREKVAVRHFQAAVRSIDRRGMTNAGCPAPRPHPGVLPPLDERRRRDADRDPRPGRG